MSLHSASDGQSGDPEPVPTQVTQSAWKRVWTNNKGMFLVLLAEVVGSSMDATARFLQQGGHGMHPFQVRNSRSYFLPLLPY